MPARHGYEIKQPAEALDLTVDFSDRLENSESIDVESVVAYLVTNQVALDSVEPADAEIDDDPVTDDLIEDDPAPFIQDDTKVLQFRVIGGESGKRYKIEVTARGDDDQIAEFDIYLDVQD